MAPNALGCRPFKNAVDVASQAGQAGVRARQWKGSLGVVERDVTPGVCHMAGSTILAKRAVVVVIFLVAGIASG